MKVLKLEKSSYVDLSQDAGGGLLETSPTPSTPTNPMEAKKVEADFTSEV